MHFVEKEYLILDVFSKHRKLNLSKSKLYNGELGNNFFQQQLCSTLLKKFHFLSQITLTQKESSLSETWQKVCPTDLNQQRGQQDYLNLAVNIFFWLQEQKLQVHEPCWFDKTVLKFSLLVWTNLLTTCNCCVWTPQLLVILLVCVQVAETGMFLVRQKTFFPCVLTWVPLENLSYLGTLKLLLVCSCNGFDLFIFRNFQIWYSQECLLQSIWHSHLWCYIQHVWTTK